MFQSSNYRKEGGTSDTYKCDGKEFEIMPSPDSLLSAYIVDEEYGSVGKGYFPMCLIELDYEVTKEKYKNLMSSVSEDEVLKESALCIGCKHVVHIRSLNHLKLLICTISLQPMRNADSFNTSSSDTELIAKSKIL